MKKNFFLLALSLCTSVIYAQEFSLKEAIDYAIINNANHKNVVVDQQIADMKQKEVLGLWKPQLSASLDVKDYLQPPTAVFDGAKFPGSPAFLASLPIDDPQRYSKGSFQIQYNNTAGIQASQLIFNSDVLVAIQASKSYSELMQKNVDRSKVDITVAVTKAYYNVLISRERIKLLDAQLERVKKMLDDTKLLNEKGFVEKIDVDRVQLGYNNLVTEKEKIGRLVELTSALLKFQMGMDMQSTIVLKDSLDMNAPIQDLPIIKEKFDYSLRADYSMTQLQLHLMELDYKRNKLKWMPTIAAYSNFSTINMSPKFDPFNFGVQSSPIKQWYPLSLIGVTMNVPIWDGGQTYYKKQQAKLNVLKTQNTLQMMESGIDMDIKISSTTYQNALSSLTTQKENIQLAQKVYDVTKIKYEQGVGGISDVVNAEASLKEAQVNYFNAMYEYLVAKTDYEKATGLIK